MSEDGPGFTIDADIRAARTPPGSFYTDAARFAEVRERVFARSWQPVCDRAELREPGWAQPVTWLEGALDEPLAIVREGEDVRCLSNACTHRAALLVEQPGRARGLTCRYHGRRFDLAGKCLGAPGFETAADFPGERDHLPAADCAVLGPLVFAAPGASEPFESWTAGLAERLAWLPLERLEPLPEKTRDYELHAHWAAYVENYLEGFHIPFVHRALTRAIDLGEYGIELFARSSLQTAFAPPADAALEHPALETPQGARVAGYFAWLFPNVMLNFYPWGLSLNQVVPLAPDRSLIRYRGYTWDPTLLDRGAGGDLDTVEREDQAIVTSAHRGLAARLRTRGSYAPEAERAVHHFHRLLAQCIGAA